MFLDDKTRIIMPHGLLSMELASAVNSIAQLKQADNFHDIKRAATTAANSLRAVDTIYFAEWERRLCLMLPWNEITEVISCKQCYKITIGSQNLRENQYPKVLALREKVNRSLIHATENKKIIGKNNITLLEEYYAELKHIGLIWHEIPRELPIKTCKPCKKKKIV